MPRTTYRELGLSVDQKPNEYNVMDEPREPE